MTRPVTISLPTGDRQRSYEFYQSALSLEPVGELAEDGVPEPLQFRLDEHTMLMLVPTGGFGWVIGDREIAPRGSRTGASQVWPPTPTVTPGRLLRTKKW